MLQAMNTGHDGSLTTLHANTPRDALSRLETMIAMASLDLPEQGDAAADRERHQRGHPGEPARRRHPQGDDRSRRSSAWKATSSPCRTSSSSSARASARTARCWAASSATGIRPRFADRLKAYGIDLAAMLFSNLVGGARRRDGVRRRWLGPRHRAPDLRWRSRSARSPWRWWWSGAGSGAGAGRWCGSCASSPPPRAGPSCRPVRCCRDAAAQARVAGARSPTAVPRVPGLGQVLEQGGLAWTPQSFLVASLGLAWGPASTILIVFPVWPAVLLAAVGAGALPYLYARRKRRRRLESFEEQLPEAIDLLGRAMRAGHPLSAGLKMVSEESPEPLAGEFRRVFEEQRFGLPFEDAILGIADRVRARRRAHPGHGDPDPARGRRQPGRGARQPRVRDPRAIHHPPPAPGVYGAGSLQRDTCWRCCRSPSGRPCSSSIATYMITLFFDPIARYFLVLAVILQILGFLWIRKIVDIEI